MKTKSTNSQTAYEYNSHSSSSDTKVEDQAWAEAIKRMIEQRYAFLDLQYEDEGYLFRGMSTGLFDALINNQFWHFDGDDRGNHFEKELNVLLISQDFSDAYTVSKIWEREVDSCIIIFKSNVFNKALNNKQAAMMATAEPGVVFKYPFLCQPLSLSEIEYIVVSDELIKKLNSKIESDDVEKRLSIFHELQNADKLIQIDIKTLNFERRMIEKEVMKSLSVLKIEGAKTIKSLLKPV